MLDEIFNAECKKRGRFEKANEVGWPLSLKISRSDLFDLRGEGHRMWAEK
jgi:hypothetical protein